MHKLLAVLCYPCDPSRDALASAGDDLWCLHASCQQAGEGQERLRLTAGSCICRAKTDKRREVPGELLERVRILSAGFAKLPDMSRMCHHRGRRFG